MTCGPIGPERAGSARPVEIYESWPHHTNTVSKTRDIECSTGDRLGNIGQADAEGGKQPEFIEFQLVRGELDLGKDAPETVPRTSEIGSACRRHGTCRGATENDPQPWTEYVWKHVRGRLRQGHSSSPSYTVFQAANHFCEVHRSEIPNLDPYVKLARQRLQSAVTMAMQVGPTFSHIPPGPEGIVAQDEVHAIDIHLSIRLDAFPAIAANDSGIVIVAGDKAFAAMQRPQ
jgi:hypothetical protein